MPPESRSEELAVLSTLVLLDRASGGDERARDVLYDRYLPRLRRWANDRLPRGARGLVDTDGLVHETLSRTLSGKDGLDSRTGGAFLGNVRQDVGERIAAELEKLDPQPTTETTRRAPEASPVPFAPALHDEQRALYERAFQRLELSDQAAIAARLEDGLSYEEIARELGSSSIDAARMAVSGAVVRLAREMRTMRTQRGTEA